MEEIENYYEEKEVGNCILNLTLTYLKKDGGITKIKQALIKDEDSRIKFISGHCINPSAGEEDIFLNYRPILKS